MADNLKERIQKLKGLAKKATPGPWQAVHRPASVNIHLDDFLNAHSLRVSAEACPSVYGLIPQGILLKADAEFVAMCDPLFILALICEIERLQEQWDTRFDTLCGNCGQRYRGPRDNNKHGLGKCRPKKEKQQPPNITIGDYS